MYLRVRIRIRSFLRRIRPKCGPGLVQNYFILTLYFVFTSLRGLHIGLGFLRRILKLSAFHHFGWLFTRSEPDGTGPFV